MKLFYSQQGEDILILLKYINKYVEDGIYLELGAVDGVVYSNTKFFEDNLGFTGVLIEPQFNMFENLRKNRPKNILVNKAISNVNEEVEFLGNNPCGGIKKNMANKFINNWHKNSKSYIVKTEKISNILEKNSIKYIDLFILDVEGGELDVVKTINFEEVEIYLFCIELDGHNCEKDNKCRNILKEKGFEFCEKFQINEFWINKNYSKIDRLYDSKKKLKFSGMNNKKMSNLGYHIFTEKHLIQSINKYLS